MERVATYCPKCGNILRISESNLDGYNRYSGDPLYSARIYCAYGGMFNRHYSENLSRLTREEYNALVESLIGGVKT